MWLLKNSVSSVVLQQSQNEVSFQGKGSGIVLTFSLHFFLNGRKFSLMNRKCC